MTTEWQPGQLVQAVDQERGGDPIPGTVAELAGAYVLVEYDDRSIMAHTPSGRDSYWASSGWRAWDGEMRWRLTPRPSSLARFVRLIPARYLLTYRVRCGIIEVSIGTETDMSKPAKKWKIEVRPTGPVFTRVNGTTRYTRVFVRDYERESSAWRAASQVHRRWPELEVWLTVYEQQAIFWMERETCRVMFCPGCGRRLDWCEDMYHCPGCGDEWHEEQLSQAVTA